MSKPHVLRKTTRAVTLHTGAELPGRKPGASFYARGGASLPISLDSIPRYLLFIHRFYDTDARVTGWGTSNVSCKALRADAYWAAAVSRTEDMLDGIYKKTKAGGY